MNIWRGRGPLFFKMYFSCKLHESLKYNDCEAGEGKSHLNEELHDFIQNKQEMKLEGQAPFWEIKEMFFFNQVKED